MIHTRQTQRPSLKAAVDSAAVAAKLDDAVAYIEQAMGDSDPRLTDLLFCDFPGDRWHHMSVQARREALVDYAMSMVQRLRNRR